MNATADDLLAELVRNIESDRRARDWCEANNGCTNVPCTCPDPQAIVTSATIIPFPTRKPASTPDAWTEEDRRAYDMLAKDRGHTQALKTVEAMRNIKRVIPGEPDRALRMAQESFRLLVQH